MKEMSVEFAAYHMKGAALRAKYLETIVLSVALFASALSCFKC